VDGYTQVNSFWLLRFVVLGSVLAESSEVSFWAWVNFLDDVIYKRNYTE